MKKLLFSLVAIASAAWFAGCSKSGSDSSTVTTTCTWVTNSSGTVCVNSAGQIVSGTSGVTSRVQYYDYKFYFSLESGQYSPTNVGNLTITNAAAYKQFLKEAMYVCDLTNYNWGGASCDTWLQGSLQVSFSVDSSMKPYLDFRAVPGQSWISGNFGIFAGAATLNPLQLYNNTTFNLINNSQGFEIRSNGSSWNGGGLKLIQLQVDKGTLNDSYFTYRLIYPLNGVATPFATGTLKRY